MSTETQARTRDAIRDPSLRVDDWFRFRAEDGIEHQAQARTMDEEGITRGGGSKVPWSQYLGRVEFGSPKPVRPAPLGAPNVSPPREEPQSAIRNPQSAIPELPLEGVPLPAPLDEDERDTLRECEAVIERGITTFLEVGEALIQIRDRRLYRLTHRTFEEYREAVWPQLGSVRRAYQMIEAAEVVRDVKNLSHGEAPPALPLPNEAQARALKDVRPEQRPEVWRRAVESAPGGKITAAHVERVVAQVNALPPVPEHTPEPPREEAALRPWVPGSNLAPMFSSALTGTGSDEWRTPQAIFLALNEEFSFDLDVCALPENALCPRFLTPEQDALEQPWTGRCWCNPPYSQLGRWIEKARRSADTGATVVLLIPARTDTLAWHEHIEGNPGAEVRFVRGRICFSEGSGRATFPSAVVIFRPPPFVPEIPAEAKAHGAACAKCGAPFTVAAPGRMMGLVREGAAERALMYCQPCAEAERPDLYGSPYRRTEPAQNHPDSIPKPYQPEAVSEEPLVPRFLPVAAVEWLDERGLDLEEVIRWARALVAYAGRLGREPLDLVAEMEEAAEGEDDVAGDAESAALCPFCENTGLDLDTGQPCSSCGTGGAQ